MSRRYVLPTFFGVVILGALVLGPLLYFALQAFWPVPFHRAMDRALLISALAAVAVLWPRLDLRSLWPLNGAAGRDLLLGLLIAALMLQTIIAVDYAVAGFSNSHLSPSRAWSRIGLAMVAAMLAAPLEETIFRGFLQQEFARRLGWRAGWIMAAGVYALAHFLKIPVGLDREPVHFWSGANALGVACWQLGADLSRLENIAKAANLFLLGLVLGGVFLRTSTLWLNAGLHGGCIFGLLLFTGLTKPDDPPRAAWLGGNILSSPVTTMVLLLLGVWLWRFYRHPSVQPEAGGVPR